LAFIWLGGVWFLLLVLCVALVGGFEFYQLIEQKEYRPTSWLGLLWLAMLVTTGKQAGLPLAVPLLTAGLIASLTVALFQVEKPLTTWMATSGVAIYIGLIMAQVVALRMLPAGVWWLLFGLLVVWTNDTAAYSVGSNLGRRKLWPRLSPKKTWEGTIGGWVGAALAGGLLAILLPLPLTFFSGAALGVVSGVFALFGDLSISMVKRQIGVKDSSNLIPGHGGVLDRLDSLLFVLPLIYQVALVIRH
jgi:phosphatidate cytidylyltransferase